MMFYLILIHLFTKSFFKIPFEQAMLTQLRAIFDLIIQFQSTQENMYAAATAELEARQALEKKAEKKTADVSILW